ncbi:MAG: glycoside hydrolase family 3 C-terminal domain-containing protein [Kiritimatiellae bacterium]|nr:glycoside hydrolase family 3 C-terminal domain-containing protein [Kiritimatiellia bacterium]
MKKVAITAAVFALVGFANAATPEELVAQLTGEERVGQLMMDSPAVPRLGIPAYHWWNEALHGVARAGLATVFPQSMAMAATFDTDLEYRVADAISTEARAKHNLFVKRGERGIYEGLTFWSPNVNLFRDPRWGRGQETFGEDPYLSGAMGTAFVKGMQGNDPKYLKVAACAKHFAVHSGPEALRHGFDAKVSPRDLAEYYLPAFKALVVEGKVESVMGAYSAVNGVPCCVNKWLLTDLLRGEWGFAGHVVSDVGAVNDVLRGHHYVKDTVEASKSAIAAGLDLCSEGTYGCLRTALKDGRVTADELSAPLVRLYRTRAKLGQFDPPGSTPWDGLGSESVANDAHRALALEAAEKSMVLVHNNGTLPLNADKIRFLGVAGPRALDEVALYGNYNGYSVQPVTCMTGIAAEAGPGVKISHMGLDGCDAIVACVGITAEDEGEEGDSGGDRKSYGIPERQIKLLKDLRKRLRGNGQKLIAVVFGCSPFDLKSLTEFCDAVVVAWYPGEQGGRALGRLLFGKANFSGRLPITYPTSYADIPDFKSYALAGRTYIYGEKAAYPFGYGLSYTTFAYSGLKLSAEKGKAVAEVTVANTGKCAGEEVVQLYVRAPESAHDRRLHHLAAFARVALNPGEAKTVSVVLPASRFEVFGDDGKPFLPAGESTVFAGGGQPGFDAGVQSATVLAEKLRD